MAASRERLTTQLPPRSTGDEVHLNHTAAIEFSGKVGNHVWQIGQMYTVDGFEGSMIHVHGSFDETSTEGRLEVHYNKTAKYKGSSLTAGANIRYQGTIVAVVDSFKDIYLTTTNIMGFDNPEYGLDVDITGSANMRFAEGLPQLDAWGKLRVSGGTQLGDYVFGQQAVFDDNFSPTKLSGGYTTYSATRHSIKVGVDYTVDPTNGFSAASTNQYHHYIAGSSHLYAGTARINSPETTGSIRQWGLFDSNNGFMFRVGTGGVNAVDDTGLSVVLRSNIPEAPQKDTIVPRAEWNGDKLDGTGDSGATLTLDNVNIWWIDVQWHGAGRVRYGTYIDGQRVVCHSYYQGNAMAMAMNQTTSLPCCFSTKSTVATTSDLYIESWSAAVWSESDIDLRAYGSPATYASAHTTITANVSDNWQYLYSLCPTPLHASGETNHSLYVPTSINAYAVDMSANNGIDAIVDLKMEINSIHAGHTFTALPTTNVELSTSGSSYQGGKVILQDMFKGRYENTLTDTFNNFQYGAVKNFADDGGTVQNNIAAISTATPAVMTTTARLMPREPETATFPLNTGGYTITGTNNSNYDSKLVYVKPTGLNLAELYEDEALTVPVNGTTEGAATGGLITGFQGQRVVWSFFAKTRTALHDDVKLMVIMNWKEIIQ
jgi:hypothetical protein